MQRTEMYHASTLIKAGRHMNSMVAGWAPVWLYSSYSHGIISWYRYMLTGTDIWIIIICCMCRMCVSILYVSFIVRKR